MEPSSKSGTQTSLKFFRNATCTLFASLEKKGAIKFSYEHLVATPEQLEEKKKFEADLKAKKAEIAAGMSAHTATLRTSPLSSANPPRASSGPITAPRLSPAR